jgi:hypothetical protein
MSITPRGMSIQEAYRLFRDDRLIVNRKYQRKLVWTLAEKQNLIDSLIKDYPIPLILFADVSESGSTYYEIMDGMQRLNAIFSFIDNTFKLNDKYFDINEFSRAKQAAEAGLFISASREDNKFLEPSMCADILDYQLAVTIFPIETEEQVTDVFSRINSGGRQLSAQEKRQAGRVDDFSMLIRELASEIRGDSSKERLPLSGMPEISIDSIRTNMGYALKAEDIFWCKQGVLWTQQLRDSEDEEMIADICASIVLGEPIARSKEYFDRIYDITDPEHERLRREFYSYGKDRLYEEVKVTLSVLKEVVEGFSNDANALRTVVNPGARNPIKGSFFAIFMAFHKLVIIEEKTPDQYGKIMAALGGLQKSMTSSAKYSTIDDRTKNIDKTTGLIQRYFVKKDTPMLRHGAGLALDMENSLRRSKLETSRYECKQGLVDLSTNRKIDTNLLKKIIETICGIANVGPNSDGFIFIGVADKKADADRIAELDSVVPITVGARYVVGLEREMHVLSIGQEQYLEKIMSFVRNSDLSEPLRSQVLSQSDYVDYKGMSVLRIRVPAQKQISFVDEKIYIRENSSTIEAMGKKLLAANALFT